MGAHLYVSLTLFVVVEYISAALCQTINFPVGVFMPVFMVGAAFGRLVGESMFAWFPSGFGAVRLISNFCPIRKPFLPLSILNLYSIAEKDSSS